MEIKKVLEELIVAERNRIAKLSWYKRPFAKLRLFIYGFGSIPRQAREKAIANNAVVEQCSDFLYGILVGNVSEVSYIDLTFEGEEAVVAEKICWLEKAEVHQIQRIITTIKF
jgi:hypothetical protein